MAKTSTKNHLSAPDFVSPVIGAFNHLVDAAKEYKMTAEVEKTKRENIKAWRDVNIKAIEESAAILKQYLESSFKERSAVIQATFRSLDNALANNNTEAVGLMMSSIVAIVKDSPLAQARQVIADMGNTNIRMIEI